MEKKLVHVELEWMTEGERSVCMGERKRRRVGWG